MSSLDGKMYNGDITKKVKGIGKENSLTGAMNFLRRCNEQTKFNDEEIEM